MSILGYEAFAKWFRDELKRSGFNVDIDHNEVIVRSKTKEAQVLPLDTLYRTYVDVSIQNPKASADDVLAYVKSASDAFNERLHRPAIFEVKNVPELNVGRVLMQKCVNRPKPRE